MFAHGHAASTADGYSLDDHSDIHLYLEYSSSSIFGVGSDSLSVLQSAPGREGRPVRQRDVKDEAWLGSRVEGMRRNGLGFESGGVECMRKKG